MAWVTGIREVRHLRVPVQEGRHGPVVLTTTLQIVDLPPEAWRETVGCRPLIFLPPHTGAGPCGTHARVIWPLHGNVPSLTPLEWSVRHLIEPLRAYYERYTPPKRFGAKPGPRGRRGIYDEVL
ncbi:MAG: hypothetical protein EPO20_14600 [Betaproteobacteria bacterium]|nr:MAG: hypothetical protein EPO20_14600 [Betaproteobacteria bacterium]